jgi:hypothetical protein
MSTEDTKGRRRFLGSMIGAAAALPVVKMGVASAAETGGHDAWLNGITGKHKCLFDFPQHKKGAGLVHMYNYIATYQAAYGADVSDINTVGTLYAVGPQASITMAFNDEMWARYRFGEYQDLTDPRTGKPSVRNLFWETMEGDEIPRVGTIGPFPDASVSAMQEKFGTVFLLCNNAAIALGMDLERLGRGTAGEITEDLLANLKPGIHVVPAMVIAIEQAQAAGMAYNKQ